MSSFRQSSFFEVWKFFSDSHFENNYPHVGLKTVSFGIILLELPITNNKDMESQEEMVAYYDKLLISNVAHFE